MQQHRRRFIAAVAAGMAAARVGTGLAQPTSVGRICNGFPPGSSADAVSRLLAVKLSALGKQYIVENRTGAGGRLAPDNIRTSAPDGQSMLVTPDAVMMLYPHVYKSLPYSPLKDFRPVTTLCSVPVAFAVGSMVPASVKTLTEFAQWCKANPQSASFGTSGSGTTLHFTGVMFARASQIDLQHVPYRGANLAAQDAAAGQIAGCVGVLTDVLPLVQGGKLRLVGISSPARSRFVAGTPTFREQGFNDIEMVTWFGAFLPAATPDARVAEIHAATVEAFRQPDVAESLAVLGMEPLTMPSQEFAATLKSDVERWGGIVKRLNYTAVD